MTTAMLAVLNSEELASKLGKKGSATDMTMYNNRKGDRTFTAVSPTRYPEKLSPLLMALYLGEDVIMVVDKLDRTIGEMMVACDVMGKGRGRIILENYIAVEQVAPLLKGTVLEEWTVSAGMGDPNVLRERLMDIEAAPREGPTRIAIDQAFNVKGVGTVSLGIVERGVVRRHQELLALPGGKRTQVRSIQVHDEDTGETSSGSRVGLALKNVEVSDVERGVTLAEEGSMEVADTLRLKLGVNRFWKDTLRDDLAVHLGLGMQFVAGRTSMGGTLRGGEEGEIEVRLEQKVAYAKDDRPVLAWLESTGPRIVGAGRIL